MEYRDTLLSLDYESQYFGIHPRSFVDIVYNQFWENMLTCLQSFKKQLMQEYTDVLAPSCINVITDELLQMLTSKLDKCIDKLELYISDNIMRINPEVVLPEDKAHVVTPCTKEEDEDIDREIEELKRKILEERAKKQIFKQVISEQNQVMRRLHLFHKELEQLVKTAAGMGMTKENIETIYCNLEKLFDVIPVQEKK